MKSKNNENCGDKLIIGRIEVKYLTTKNEENREIISRKPFHYDF